LLIFASAAFENKRFNIFIFAILIGSLFFTLAINNNLRQGISITLILLAFQRKTIDLRFLTYTILASFFHASALLFLSLLMFLLIWLKYLQNFFTFFFNYLLIILFG
jgi:hypothetical protein